MKYRVEYSEDAERLIASIKDRRVKRKLLDRIDELDHDPLLQGEPLEDELKGYRSIRAVGQRYRVIYKVEADRVLVFVFWLGLRREGSPDDVYVEATKATKKRTEKGKKRK